jgi:predicted  nucleic acid-binding Zn-ribbon protein
VDFEGAIKQLQDTLIVVAAIQERQAKVQRLQAEELDAVRTLLIEGQKLHEQRMAKFDEKMLEIEEKMLEIEDKLNGLIGYLDYRRRPPE